MCLQKFPPSLQIFQNLPLDSYLSYLHVLAEIPPPSLQIFQNLPLDSYLSYLHVLAGIPPQFADFPKSATGQLPQLPTCACRNTPPIWRFSEICHWTVTEVTYMCLQKFCPPFGDFPKSVTGQLLKLPTCACRNAPPPFGDFQKSATGQLPKLPTCACRNSAPHLEIFQNLSLDSYLSYLHVLAEIPPPIWRFSEICHWTVTEVTYMCLQKFCPPFGDFPKSATGQLPKLPTCACRNSPPVCRFSKICHWTVT